MDEEKKKPGELSRDEKFWLSAIALMTPLVGGALGGAKGALAGGAAGLGAVGSSLAAKSKADAERLKEEREAEKAAEKLRAEISGKQADKDEQRKFLASEKETQRQFQAEQNRLARENTRVLAESAAADRVEKRTESSQLAREKARNADVEQLGKRFAPLSSMFNSVAEIESKLGFNVDDATVDDKGNLIAGGKYQDLPGMNLPFIGRTQFYDQNARDLGSALANLYNTILKDRSGAAVTENELRRLELETGGGKFDSEANMVRGLQAIKRALRNSAGAARSSFSPEAVAEYERRGSRLDAIDPLIAKDPGEKHADGDSGTAIANPSGSSLKDPDEMTEAEMAAEEARLRKAGVYK